MTQNYINISLQNKLLRWDGKLSIYLIEDQGIV